MPPPPPPTQEPIQYRYFIFYNIDPNFFAETSKKVEADGWWSSGDKKKIPFQRYQSSTKDIHRDITFSFGTVKPITGDRDTTKAGEYGMKSWPHGVAVIINNEQFREHSQREGTAVDEKNLVHAFHYLGYIVEVHRDRTAKQIYDIVKQIKDRDHSSYDSFVCCILSHGKEGHVHGSDSMVIPLKDVTGLLDGDSCKTLVGKPKVFIMQACRGKQKGTGVRADGDDEQFESRIASDSEARIVSDSDNKIPAVADFFYGYATPLGQVAWRDLDNGSWYISELCRSLASYACCSNLETIMKITSRRVGEEYTNELYKQSPETTSRLTKDVFFF